MGYKTFNMKISKGLLKSIAVGITFGTMASCSTDVIETNENLIGKEVDCICGFGECVRHAAPPFDCPACGMG